MIGLISQPGNDLWWHGSYIGIWDALSPKKGQNRPTELLQKSKSCKNQPNSLRIHLFPTKFAARGLFGCKANSNHVFLTMTTRYCEITQLLQNRINCQKTEFFMIFTSQSCIFEVHRYFYQLWSSKMGAVKKNDIKTPHDAVRYCTNTPIEYKLPKIEWFFKSFFLVIYLELYRLRPSKMGAYVTTALNTDPNAVKYC